MANEHIYVCTTLGLPLYNNPDLCGSSDATPNPQSIDSDFFSRNLLFIVKNFMDPLEVINKHQVLKIGVLHPLFCIGMLGKSTRYST